MRYPPGVVDLLLWREWDRCQVLLSDPPTHENWKRRVAVAMDGEIRRAGRRRAIEIRNRGETK